MCRDRARATLFPCRIAFSSPAAALAGGVLPAAYAERREQWLVQLMPARA
jgi:hypothetical protein